MLITYTYGIYSIFPRAFQAFLDIHVQNWNYLKKGTGKGIQTLCKDFFFDSSHLED